MAVLRELKGSRMFPLCGKMTVIGRDLKCDIVVGAGQVSRRHAIILQSGSAYYIEDLDSTHGTFVNGQRIQQRTHLMPNDRLEIGDLQVVFRPEAPGPEAAGPEEAAGTRLPATEPLGSIVSSLEVAAEPRVEVAPEAKLRAILEISRNLGHALSLTVVLPKILESLFAIFPQADRGFILLSDSKTGRLVPGAARSRHGGESEPLPISQTVVNHALLTGRAILSADARLDERFDPSLSVRRLNIRSIMCVPMLSEAGTRLGVIQVDTQDKHHRFREEDLDVLVSACLQAGRAVELAQFHQEQRDLEAATQIQKSFLPDERPRVEGLQFFDYYGAARHVGGDYYDYIPLPGNRLAVALGDVSGKGVSAALLMARLSAAVRFCLATTTTPAEAVRQLSSVLTRAGSDDRFVTFVVAVLDLANFTITLVNAGHPPPLQRSLRRATVEDVADEVVGLPLAVIDRPYEEKVIPLELGDTLVLFTDGVTEARGPAGEFYGLDRLRAAVQKGPADVELLGQAILAEVQQFAAGQPQSDDLTLVCFGRR